MITKVIEYVLVLRSLLGLFLLGVLSLWQPPYQIPRYWFSIQYGFLDVLYMLGVLLVGVPLVCSLIIYFWSPSTVSD
jgi:hypothetical protein